jgi:ribonucleoside-diphosphate reductase alpha chain
MSAGARRGAMMTTLRCDHPDIEEFIEAKHQAGKLTNTNVSVLITDKFMEAVKQDLDWTLVHEKSPYDNMTHTLEYQLVGGPSETQKAKYVYKTIRARDLWDKIMRSTYEFAEPGVIFIDRMNRWNNLRGLETLSCTNPCGEQPLPPNGCCLLGAINLGRLVRTPFHESASFDFDLLAELVDTAIRFLDRVIDVTRYPLPEQQEEQKFKRRIGLGVMGLGDMLCQMQLYYGSTDAQLLVDRIFQVIRDRAYQTSSALAREFGVYPLYQQNPERCFSNLQKNDLPDNLITEIRGFGIRNSHLLTVAPTGTTGTFLGNASGGIEPIFAHRVKRNIRQPDGSYKPGELKSYALQVLEQIFPNGTAEKRLNSFSYFRTAEQIAPTDHIMIQAAAQKYIDASVSKTINCPSNISFEDFKHVYELAYETGCKGCTTYRPSEVRGAILESLDNKESDDRTLSGAETTVVEAVVSESQTEQVVIEAAPAIALTPHIIDASKPRLPAKPKRQRPDVLSGLTHKIAWPNNEGAYYLTINVDDEGAPVEVMMNTKNAIHDEWIKGLTLMITAIMRSVDDPKEASFIATELKQVTSSHNGAWVDGKYYPSMLSYVGSILEEYYLDGLDPIQSEETVVHVSSLAKEALDGMADALKAGGLTDAAIRQVFSEPKQSNTTPILPRCPKCNSTNIIRKEGCYSCGDCLNSNCG